jgi:hypothetical protein
MTNDIDEFTALNLDFVASAQNSDVRRSRRTGDTPIAGRSRTENGSRYRRM